MSSRSKRGYAGRRNRKLRPELIPGPAQYISPGLPDFPNGLLDRAMELIQFARARVGYKAPEEIIILDEMPRTATGKVDRTNLKRMAEANLARRG